MTSRPEGIVAGAHTADDGLFGPDSVTWRVMASPSIVVAGHSAAMVQMLLPAVMHVIDQSSSVRLRPEQRAQRTGDYTVTITYGDVASAERAGEQLRRLHATRSAVDPTTGQRYQADDPDLLVWVHNALTWILLRGFRTYGPSLTADEENQFVAEQREVAARLVGCDIDAVTDTVTGLEQYMESMLPRLAMTTPALWFKDMMVPSDWALTPDVAIKKTVAHASVLLMGDEHRALYGFRLNRLQRFTTVATTRALLNAGNSKTPIASAIPQIREYVDAHAFGARRVKVVDPG